MLLIAFSSAAPAPIHALGRTYIRRMPVFSGASSEPRQQGQLALAQSQPQVRARQWHQHAHGPASERTCGICWHGMCAHDGGMGMCAVTFGATNS